MATQHTLLVFRSIFFFTWHQVYWTIITMKLFFAINAFSNSSNWKRGKWLWLLTSEVHGPVLPWRQHHSQSCSLNVWQSRQLLLGHCCRLLVGEHADLPLVKHHLQEKDGRQSSRIQEFSQVPHKPTDKSDMITFEKTTKWLTANLSGDMIAMASLLIPSICSLTNADMAMSGRPAVKSVKYKFITNGSINSSARQ